MATHDRIAGMGSYYKEAYWTFDNDGPILLDLGIIKDTVEKLLPPKMHVYRCIGFQIEKLSYDMGVEHEWDGYCCASH